MKPVNAGSPVASVYRISSVLKIVWSRTAIPTTQSSDSPFRTNAVGPSRNSPLPMETPRIMTPGPTALSHPSPWGLGGTGRSARDHGSSPDRASGETASDVGMVTRAAILNEPVTKFSTDLADLLQ